MSEPVKLINLLKKWLDSEFQPPYQWERYSTYIEGYYILRPNIMSDLTIWVQDPPDTESIEIEWWFDQWNHEKFKIVDPNLFIKLKDRIDSIMPLNPGTIRPSR